MTINVTSSTSLIVYFNPIFCPFSVDIYLYLVICNCLWIILLWVFWKVYKFLIFHYYTILIFLPIKSPVASAVFWMARFEEVLSAFVANFFRTIKKFLAIVTYIYLHFYTFLYIYFYLYITYLYFYQYFCPKF